jgi:ABC-type sulfate/molybdate transport systems ATPase subunit
MGAEGDRVSEFLRLAVERAVADVSIGVSFSLSAPWTLLFGPSGSGKTSLLRIIAGLSRPDRGRVVLNGVTLVDTENQVWIAPGRRAIGLVTQDPVLFPHLNVLENVSFGLLGLSRVQREEQTGEMVELFDLKQLVARNPRRLSGGEKQRVALARALAPEPQLLMLDEPFTGMDADLKEGLLRRLSDWLIKRKIPALYVSHDVTEAFAQKADVLLIKAGQIVGRGPAHEVLADRRNMLLRQLEIPTTPPEPSARL